MSLTMMMVVLQEFHLTSVSKQAQERSGCTAPLHDDQYHTADLPPQLPASFLWLMQNETANSTGMQLTESKCMASLTG